MRADLSLQRPYEAPTKAIPGAETRLNDITVNRKRPLIAVIIPCYNEEAAVDRVVADFRRELPEAMIHVFDNNSTDRTVEIATAAGAIISHEMRKGKGSVVKSMFRKVDADIYIMVDGDSTYPADKVHKLLAPILQGEADMVVGSRLVLGSSAMKRFNLLGNLLFRVSLNTAFGCHLTDILSGYRVMTRECVRHIAVLSQGFQIETEITIQALHQKLRIIEVPITLAQRPAGGESKIRIVSDGFNILWTIIDLFRTYRPLTVFGGAGLCMVSIGVLLGGIVIVEFFETGLVLRFPTAILASALVLAGLLSLSVGLILNTLSRSFREMYDKLISLEQRIG